MKNSFANIVPYIGEVTQTKVGDVTWASSNPDTSKYVTANGQKLLATSYGALTTAGFHPLSFSNETISTPFPFGYAPSPGRYINSTYIIGGFSTVIYSTNGVAWTSITNPTDTQIVTQAATTEGYVTQVDTKYASDLTWDAVSSKWVLFMFVKVSDGAGSNVYQVQIWSTPTLSATPTWTSCGTLYHIASGLGTSPTLQIENNGTSWVLVTAQNGIYTKSFSSAINISTGWTNSDSSIGNLRVLNNNFVVFGTSTGTGVLKYSSNGTTWSTTTISTPASTAIAEMTYCQGNYVFLKSSGGQIAIYYTSALSNTSWTTMSISGLSAGTQVMQDPYQAMASDGTTLVVGYSISSNNFYSITSNLGTSWANFSATTKANGIISYVHDRIYYSGNGGTSMYYLDSNPYFVSPNISSYTYDSTKTNAYWRVT